PQGRDVLPELADLVQPSRTDRLAPQTPRLGVANSAGAVPSVVGIRHQPAFQVTAGPHRPKRPVRNIQSDHLGCLIGRALGESRRERFRIGALVGGSDPVPVISHRTLFSGAITHRLITRCYEFREYVIT